MNMMVWAYVARLSFQALHYFSASRRRGDVTPVVRRGRAWSPTAPPGPPADRARPPVEVKKILPSAELTDQAGDQEDEETGGDRGPSVPTARQGTNPLSPTSLPNRPNKAWPFQA